MVPTLRALIAVAATSLAFAVTAAAPAQADEESYLQSLQPKYVFLTPQQLLAAGYKVCEMHRSGIHSADAVNTVSKDLAVSLTVATDIVAAAAVKLGC